MEENIFRKAYLYGTCTWHQFKYELNMKKFSETGEMKYRISALKNLTQAEKWATRLAKLTNWYDE